MKRTLTLFLVAIVASLPQYAAAEIDSLTIRFAGGCKESNRNGACVIRATADGSELENEAIVLQHSNSSRGRFRNVSRTPRSLDENGRATFRFRNFVACFRAINDRNGDDEQDVRSNVVCESGSSSNSSSSRPASSSSASSVSSSASSSSTSSAGSSSSVSSNSSSSNSSVSSSVSSSTSSSGSSSSSGSTGSSGSNGSSSSSSSS